MSEEYEEMFEYMNDLTPAIHSALLINIDDSHVMDNFIDKLNDLNYIPLPAISFVYFFIF